MKKVSIVLITCGLLALIVGGVLSITLQLNHEEEPQLTKEEGLQKATDIIISDLGYSSELIEYQETNEKGEYVFLDKSTSTDYITNYIVVDVQEDEYYVLTSNKSSA